MNPTDLQRVRVLVPDPAAATQRSPIPSRDAALFERYRRVAAAAAAGHDARTHDDATDTGTDEPDPQPPQPTDDAAHDAAHAEAFALYAAHAARAFALQARVYAARDGGGATTATAATAATAATVATATTATPVAVPPDPQDTQQHGDAQSDADERDGDRPSRDGDNARNGEPDAGRGYEPLPGTRAPTAAATAAAIARAAATGSTEVTAAAAVAPAGSPPHRVLDYLVAQTAGFCTNPAALARGNWQLSLSLDPQQLPDCELHLSLSHFDLVLRFETTDAQSRQLICAHADTLRERLAALLAKSAAHRPRNIEITVS